MNPLSFIEATDSGSIGGVQKACEISSGKLSDFLADSDWSFEGSKTTVSGKHFSRTVIPGTI